jgi:hypothetical protein
MWAWLGRERPIADLLDGKRTIDSQVAAVAPFLRDALTDLDALDPAPFLKLLENALTRGDDGVLSASPCDPQRS